MTPGRVLLDAFDHGRPIVERLLGVALPAPDPTRAARLAGSADPDPRSAPDRWYGTLLAAMAGEGLDAELGWVRLLPSFAALVPDDRMRAARADAVDLARLEDEALVRLVAERVDIREVDLVASVAAGPFVSIKLNHGFWECVTRTAYGVAGLPYYRDWTPWAEHVAGRFDDLTLLALDRVHSAGIAGPAGAGWLCGDRFAFGLSPRNGDDRAWASLVPPLHPNAHGATVGFLAVLGALAPGVTWHVADGSAAKQLVWEDRVAVLASTLAAATDALLVIGPPHLADLDVPAFDGTRESLIVPERFVHEQWPAVLPILVGRIAALAEDGRRVTVIVQAGATAALVGLVMALWSADRAMAQVRYLDLGQLLDIVARDDPRAGTWVNKDRVVDRFAAGVATGFTRRD